jgi:hypothetical protein
MDSILTFVAVLGLAGIGLIVATLKRERDRKVFSSRESIRPTDVYTQYYRELGSSETEFLDVWNEIATTLKVPADKLRPTDRFGEQIGAYLITSEELDVLAQLATRRAQNRRSRIEIDKLKSVDDYVRAFAVRGAAPNGK